MVVLTDKSKGLDFTCITSKFAPSACISFGFLSGDAEIDSIKTTGECDESVVYQTLFRLIKQKLKGNAILVGKTKITKICAKTIDGEMLISITCFPAYSAIRRIARIVLKELKPISYKLYSDNVKEMGLKPDEEYFNAALNTLTKALQSVSIVITGKTGINDQNKMKEFVEYVTKGYSATSVESAKGKKRSEKVQNVELSDQEGKPIPLSYLKCDSPIVASLLKDFVEFKLNTKIMLKDNKVVFPERKLKKVQSLNKKVTIEAYVKSLLKQKDPLELVLYYSAHRCRMNKSKLSSHSKDALKVDSLVKSLEKALS